MAETVIGPDCEELVIDYLAGLVAESVSSNSPETHAGVRVTEVPAAGFQDKIVYSSRLTLEAWAPSRPAASELARRCCAHLEAATTFYAECGSPGYFPDPDTGTPRYVATVELVTRGVLL